MSDDDLLAVRVMTPGETELRIDYFHGASDDHLRLIGVDRELLPTREAWREFYRVDGARPLDSRENYSLVWERNDRIVGFSSTDQIRYGEQAFMHLHIIDASDRRAGLGARFVRLSARAYFRDLRLRRLYCQPNAFNVGPNRTLQHAGFRYVWTRRLRPSHINFEQPVTRWVIEAPPPEDEPGGDQ